VKNRFLLLNKVLPLAALAANCALAQQENMLDEIVVTSSRIEMPLRHVATAMSVVDREELEMKGYSSLADVLRTEAAVGVTNSGGEGKTTSLRIRGEEGYRTLLLIDGVDMADPTGTQIGPQLQHVLNSYDLERIEVLRGPQGFMYGADAGGVVNVITTSGAEGLTGGLSIEAGDLGTTNIGGRIAGGNQTANFSLSISDYSTDGFNSRTDDTLLQDDDGAENTTIHLKTGWNISDALSTSLVYRDIDAEYDYDACGFPSAYDCTGGAEHRVGKISLNYQAGNLSQTFSYAQSEVSSDTFAAGVSSFYTEGETKEFEYLAAFELSSGDRFVFGSDYEEDDITTVGNEIDRQQLGVYGEFQFGIGEQIFVTAGLRYDDNSDFGKHTSGRVSAAYVQDLASGSSLKYRATYGTGFRAPSLSEVAYNDGPFAFGDAVGIEFSEETSSGYDIGVDYLLSNGAQLQATYFDQRIEDEIFFDLIAFSGYLQESGETESSGIELAVEYPVTDALLATANYTYNETNASTGLTRSRRPERLANLGLTYAALVDRLHVSANLRISKDSFNDVFGVGLVPLEDYQVVDLSAKYRLNQSLELFGRIQNLTDEDYEEVTGFNTADRSVYLGARYNF